MGKERRVLGSGGLTREYLMEILHYDPCNGVWTWKVDRGPCNPGAGDIAGTIGIGGHRNIVIDYKPWRSAHLAFLYMEGRIPEMVNHNNEINGDDRWENLSASTWQKIQRKVMMYSNNISGVTGVGCRKNRKKWEARIRVDDNLINLGSYNDFTDAVMARYCGELKFDWGRSNPNTTAKQYVDKYFGRITGNGAKNNE